MERKPPRRTRERILERSLDLFNEHGEPNVTVAAIGDDLGISPGNLYYHFRSKDEISDALFEQHEREMDGMFREMAPLVPDLENAWLFLQRLFALVWRHRFVYRDINDLLTRHRRFELQFQRLLSRKDAAARLLCGKLAEAGALQARPRDLDALAINMTLVSTWWLSFEYVRHARRFGDPALERELPLRGAYQVLALLEPHLTEAARASFDRITGREAG